MKNFIHLVTLYWNRRMLAIFFWAYAAGIPLLLVMSTLATRLYEHHVSLVKIGLFGLVTLPYALKFLYAPLIETTYLPVLSRYVGRARAWMLLMLVGVMAGLVIMGLISPRTTGSINLLFVVALITCFCSATYDIAEAEVRIELLSVSELGIGSTCYTVGYRFGMVTASGLALIIAQKSNWTTAYDVMATLLLIGIVTTLLKKQASRSEPPIRKQSSAKQILSAYISPLKSFFSHKASFWVLLLVVLYLVSEQMMVNTLNPFLLSIGFNKGEIGGLISIYGLVILVVASLVSGVLIAHFGYLRIMLISSILLFCVIGCLMGLAYLHQSIVMTHSVSMRILTGIISLHYLSIGIGTGAYMTMMAYFCRRPYTASQNALMTSLMAGSNSLMLTLSGLLASSMHWFPFFTVVAILLLPAVVVILYAIKHNVDQT